MKRLSVFSLCLTLLQAYIANGGNILPSAHPQIGTKFETSEILIELVSKKQNYNWNDKSFRDQDIYSPKSVNIDPSGKKFYVNSLEGGTTVVYDFNTLEKLTVIHHKFSSADSALWAPGSGYFKFNHKYSEPETFTGKPVESTFTHKGRYLWVPYYRRSFDLNAQEPSALAVIDTRNDSIVKLFETGPLPKMIATSPDGEFVAVTHWGDNTVGLINVSSIYPDEWRYAGLYVVDRQLKLDLPLNSKVDRDVNSGYCLRGTVFTPNGRYLLVGCMGGGGGIAVIDVRNSRYLGRVMGAMPNLRHLVLDRGYLYASINNAGYVQKIALTSFLDCIGNFSNGTVVLKGWENCKVNSGARTMVLSPDGKWAFVACNSSSCISVLRADTMTYVGCIKADSYPVGLDISKDGQYLISTSQGRSGVGGNCVDIFKITYK